MREVSVASTTDEMAAVRAAADATNAELEGAAMLAPVEAAPPENDGPTDEVRDETVSHEERHRPRQGTSVQRRIDRLTAQKYQLQEEVYALRRQLQDRDPEFGRAETTEVAQQPEPELHGQNEANLLIDQSMVSRRTKPQTETLQQPTAQEYDPALVDKLNAHAERMTEALQDPAVRDAIASGANQELRWDLMACILEESNSHDITIFLAQHPEETKKLNAMEPGQSYRELAKLAARLEGQASPAPFVRRPRARPEHIRPVGGSSTTSNVPLDEMSYSDFRRHREAQERISMRR